MIVLQWIAVRCRAWWRRREVRWVPEQWDWSDPTRYARLINVIKAKALL